MKYQIGFLFCLLVTKKVKVKLPWADFSINVQGARGWSQFPEVHFAVKNKVHSTSSVDIDVHGQTSACWDNHADIHKLHRLGESVVLFLRQLDQEIQPAGGYFLEGGFEGLGVQEKHLISKHTSVDGSFNILSLGFLKILLSRISM